MRADLGERAWNCGRLPPAPASAHDPDPLVCLWICVQGLTGLYMPLPGGPLAAADSGSGQVGSASGEVLSKGLALRFWGPTVGLSPRSSAPSASCAWLRPAGKQPRLRGNRRGVGRHVLPVGSGTCLAWAGLRKLSWTSQGPESKGPAVPGSRIPDAGPWCGPAPWRPQGPGPGPLTPSLLFLTWPDSLGRVRSWEREPCPGVGVGWRPASNPGLSLA